MMLRASRPAMTAAASARIRRSLVARQQRCPPVLSAFVAPSEHATLAQHLAQACSFSTHSHARAVATAAAATVPDEDDSGDEDGGGGGEDHSSLSPLSRTHEAPPHSQQQPDPHPSVDVCACPSPPCGKCDYLQYDRDHALHPYASPAPSRTAIPAYYPVQSASGPYLTFEDGRQVLDGMSSWWAAVHGYRHPALDAAARRQMEDSMSHVMFGGLTHKPASQLCKRLVELTPNNAEGGTDGDVNDLTKVFLCDSGSVSVEVAMKMAVQYQHAVRSSSYQSSSSFNNHKAKTKFLSLRNGYHGDTFGAMSVCDPVNGMHSLFTGVGLPEQLFVDSPDGPSYAEALQCAEKVEQTLAQHSDEIAAVIYEPVVQGAGGMKFYHPVLLQKLRKLCDAHGTLLIFDEIATGFGRTGSLFAYCHDSNGKRTYRPWSSNVSEDDIRSNLSSGNVNDERGAVNDERGLDEDCSSGPVVPDILCLGKALTGGYVTLGATLTTRRVAEGIASGQPGIFMHGPTFMGNPLACFIALTSLELLSSSPWQENVNMVRDALIRTLAPASSLNSVKEVRVLGAIGVIELHEPISDVASVQRCLVNDGVWLRPFGKLLYAMPPFNCPDLKVEHVEQIGKAMVRAVEMVEARGRCKHT